MLCNFPVDILLLFVQETNWSSIQMQHLSRFFFTNKLFNILFSIIEYTNIYSKSWSSVAGGIVEFYSYPRFISTNIQEEMATILTESREKNHTTYRFLLYLHVLYYTLLALITLPD